MAAEELLLAFGRATLFTSASAIVAWLLLRCARIDAPRIHRAAWLLVVVQSWLLFPWVWQIESAPTETETKLFSVERTTSTSLSANTSSPVGILQANDGAQQNWRLAAQAVFAAWLVGMAMLALSRVQRYCQFVRKLPAGGADADALWQRDWQRQLRATQIRRHVELRTTDDLGPLLCFVPFRYLVLAPRALWSGLTRGERQVIMRHELAHLVRGDLWWALAIRVLALPQWFNPLVWRAVRGFDEAGEWACDDMVARRGRGRELVFARSLLTAAEYATVAAPGTLAMQGGELSRRIRRLVSRRFKEEAMAKKFLVLLPLAAIAAVQLVRIERVTADEPRTDKMAESSVQHAAARLILPPYVIEPPDILMIEAVKLIPKAPHVIEPFDSLLVRVLGALPDQPIADAFAVDPDGKIDLGPTYGRVEVTGQTVDEARETITRQLAKVLESPQVSVSLAASAGAQQIQGEHLVGPDGRVNLGVYGTVYLTGLTIEEARNAIEHQLSEYLEKPQVVIDIFAFNSKKYYVITQDPKGGDNVVQFPITGNDSVLDAMAQVGGVPQRSNKIWVARPAPNGVGMEQILPVNWEEISQGQSMATNYQLHPGDRVFVKDLTQPKIEDATKYKFEIDLIEDPGNELAAFDAKRGVGPFAVFDSDTIRPALGILAKHQLIKQLSSPKLTCFAGQTATLETSAIGKVNSLVDGLKLHVFAGEFDKGLVVNLRLDCDSQGQHYEFNSSVPVKVGQTILIRANADDWQSPVQDPKPLYVALTPTVVEAAPPASFGLDDYQRP